jgi:hypothetical protein
MVIGIFVGITLVMVGLALLAHLSYLNYDCDQSARNRQSASHAEAGGACPEDPSSSLYKTGKGGKINDCPLPLCFFQVSAVSNHETWIVAFLLGGSAVLLLSLSVGY